MEAQMGTSKLKKKVLEGGEESLDVLSCVFPKRSARGEVCVGGGGATGDGCLGESPPEAPVWEFAIAGESQQARARASGLGAAMRSSEREGG